MNRRHLRYFVAIAESGGFTAASRLLNISQPALLYQMNELEGLLGTKLFRRHSRGVELTGSGSTFLPSARDLLGQYEAIETAAAPFHETPGDTIQMGFAPTSARRVAPTLVAKLAAERPELKISLRQALSGTLINLVLKGELDCAFCFDLVDTRGRFLPLFQEHLCLIGAREDVDADEGPIRFAELERFRLVIDSDYQGTRRIVEDMAERHGIRLTISVESNFTEFTRQLVRFHGRTTIAPYGLYADVLEENGLGVRRIFDPPIPLIGGLVFRPGLPREMRRLLHARLKVLVDAHIAAGDLGWMASDAGA